MTEELTAEEQAQAQQTEDTCQQGQQQAAKQKAEEAMKAAADQAAQMASEAAKVPIEMINQLMTVLDQIFALLTKLPIPGVPDATPAFDPSAIIKTITDAVVKTAMAPITAVEKAGVSLPGPLDKIPELLSQMSALASDTSGQKAIEENEIDIAEMVPNLPDIPPEIQAAIDRVTAAVKSLFEKIQWMSIKLICMILDLVLKMFDTVAGYVGGLPLLSQATTMFDSLDKFVSQVPDILADGATQIKIALEGMIRQKVREIQALKLPKPPENLEAPKSLPTCPNHSAPTEESSESTTSETTSN